MGECACTSRRLVMFFSLVSDVNRYCRQSVFPRRNVTVAKNYSHNACVPTHGLHDQFFSRELTTWTMCEVLGNESVDTLDDLPKRTFLRVRIELLFTSLLFCTSRSRKNLSLLILLQMIIMDKDTCCVCETQT